MKKLISIISIILALLLLLPSCTKKTGSDDYDHAADFTEEDGEIYKSVPKERYNGYEFCILNARAGTSASVMDADTVVGDSLNEALLHRNFNVEERLGITVSEVLDTPEKVFDIAVSACLSGEETYDAVCNSANHMATMAVCGYLVTDLDLPGLDLTKPWWNEKAVDSSCVDSARFFFFGDIQLSYFDAHSMVGVNMDMVSDISGMPDPYDLVDNGKWTVDEMIRMMNMADADMDGNGSLTWEDRYGAALDRSGVISLIVGCNSYISTRDEYGLPELSCFTDDKLYDVYALLSDTLYSRNEYIYDTVKNEADGMSAAAMFKNGYSLFHITTVGELANLRTMEYEFGVLPMPKYSENQTDYVSLIHAPDATAVGVMKTGRDLRRTGGILENLAAESHREKGIRRCYVDSVLSFVYLNDEKSRKNLDIILSSGVFEPSQIYGWGGICEKISEIAGKKDIYASSLASVRLKAISDVSDTIEEVNRHR
ncbi:MAG: hypothetical protein E7647_01335 [Ruminococcaceae bacterium]|nr:hypothetical protein [Oscillospiraceae bacterium]